MWWNSTQIVMKLKKTQNVMELKKPNCDKIKNKNPSCDETPIKWWQNSKTLNCYKTEIVTKIKKILKLWQKKLNLDKVPIVTKFNFEKVDKPEGRGVGQYG